jgi:hypothetical protein
MSNKTKVLSWILPVLPMAVGVGFTLITFITGESVNETHVQLLDYLLVSTLGTGAIGAAKAGHSKYTEYKAKPAP